MKFALFYHSVLSCWNNGNAHFTRGIIKNLLRAGHEVAVHEPVRGWSRENLIRDHGIAQLDNVRSAPQVLGPATGTAHPLELNVYHRMPDLDACLADCDVVIVHEWTDPELVAAIGRKRRAGGRFTLLFHDTHHRAISAPEEWKRIDLQDYDAVLAFGDSLRQVYERHGWGERAYTWHEAADTDLFFPRGRSIRDFDLVWIGNWGDGERAEELEEFLLQPVERLGLNAIIHGVRYPSKVTRSFRARNICYGNWLPNHEAPQAFANARMTVHVPRRQYAETLPGIPTIRVFEALACGIPLVSAPWEDCEGLFPPGAYAKASNGQEMEQQMWQVLQDRSYAAELSRTGLDAILRHHTCQHRVADLLAIVRQFSAHPGRASVPHHDKEYAAL